MVETYKCLLCGTTTLFPHSCPEFFSEGVKQINIQQFKLMCISDDKFTDAEIKTLTTFVVFKLEEDILEFCAILQKYRPELWKEFKGVKNDHTS